jgi:hypothetical protein
MDWSEKSGLDFGCGGIRLVVKDGARNLDSRVGLEVLRDAHDSLLPLFLILIGGVKGWLWETGS